MAPSRELPHSFTPTSRYRLLGASQRMSAHRSQISDALSQNGFTESEIGSSSKRYLAHTVEPSNLVSNFVVPGLPKAGCKNCPWVRSDRKSTRLNSSH